MSLLVSSLVSGNHGETDMPQEGIGNIQTDTVKKSLTRHAVTRMQQRGINLDTVACVLAFGQTKHDRHGAIIHYLNKKARKHIQTQAGKNLIKRLDKLMNTYVVVSCDGNILTIGHRYKPIRNH